MKTAFFSLVLRANLVQIFLSDVYSNQNIIYLSVKVSHTFIFCE